MTYSATSKNSWLEVLRKYLCKKSCIGYAESKNKIFGDSQIHADVNPSSSSTSFMGSMSTSCHTMLFPKGMEGFAKALGHGVEGYSSLEIYEKLQLLILLCDDVLSTTYMRLNNLLINSICFCVALSLVISNFQSSYAIQFVYYNITK